MKNKETLEEVAKNYATDMSGTYYEELDNSFKAGAKWQEERSYSEEEVIEILDHHTSYLETFISQYIDRQDMEVNEEWFEQYKKK